ncbi:MAG: tyrosine/phenylalanine carboxypeptidase domain-containing protein, partial [Polyangiaceae bacterium]
MLDPRLRRIEAAMERAVNEVRLLAAATPTNAVAERARLIAAAENGRPLVPMWTYAPPRRTDARPVLDATREALDELGADPLAAVYRARVDEIAIEADLVAAVGTPSLATKAAARFAPFAETTRRAAAVLRDEWVHADVRADDDPAEIPTDSPDPNSLLSILEREVGARGLPFRVRVHPALSSLAATGDRILLVAAGRAITKRTALRTALHEIEGHALPRLRATERELGIFRLGTARGVDEQEG